MPWLQLKIQTAPEHTSAIEKVMLGLGAASVTYQDAADQPILEPGLNETPLWDRTIVTGLFEAAVDTGLVLSKICETNKIPEGNCTWEQLEDKDWEREWMKSYHPIHCGHDLWICPSWIAPPEPQATNLMLDPGLAFGTGTHPTTFLCLRWLAEMASIQALLGKSTIDYGCGSGILGIAALLLGAENSLGIDIDPQALIATQENCLRNNIAKSSFPVYLPEDAPQSPTDIVVANILAGPLAELSENISNLVKPGGLLCLSGIIESQAEATMDAYRDQFQFEAPRSLDGWVCLTATKQV